MASSQISCIPRCRPPSPLYYCGERLFCTGQLHDSLTGRVDSEGPLGLMAAPETTRVFRLKIQESGNRAPPKSKPHDFEASIMDAGWASMVKVKPKTLCILFWLRSWSMQLYTLEHPTLHHLDPAVLPWRLISRDDEARCQPLPLFYPSASKIRGSNGINELMLETSIWLFFSYTEIRLERRLPSEFRNAPT